MANYYHDFSRLNTMHRLVATFWNWNVICIWISTFGPHLCTPKKKKYSLLQWCHFNACEFCVNENWSHIWNLKLAFHNILNIFQHKLILIIRPKPHCFIPNLFICCKFAPPIKHRHKGARWTFCYFGFTIRPFRLDGWIMNLWICNCPCNMEDLLIVGSFKNIQGLMTMAT